MSDLSPEKVLQSKADSRLKPVQEDEFAQLMSVITLPRNPFRVGVAVSGGADSMALCLLLRNWVTAKGGELFAVTVDHGLRPESGIEAQWVHVRLLAEGIEHEVLTRSLKTDSGGKGSSQVRARKARHDLIAKWCRDKEIFFLALGHHLDDQIETFLMRLVRQSRSDGLAGISMQRQDAAMTLIRPLLRLPKERLIETLRHHGWGWIEEPSNQRADYLRNRIRQKLPVIERQGVKRSTLVRITHSLGRIRRSLQKRTDAFIDQKVRLNPVGYAEIDFNESEKIQPDIFKRALQRTLLTIGGGNYSPGTAKLDRLVLSLMNPEPTKMTLAGCEIVQKDHTIFLVRENRLVPQLLLTPGLECLWDNRFFVQVHEEMKSSSLLLRTLGERGWQDLCELHPAVKNIAVSSFARYSLPAVYHGDKIITVPHLEYLNPDWIDEIQMKIRFEPKNMLIQLPFTVA
ncbi:tRNA lysidine(34) synthetase TilS [Kiloniella litopenaei]|uniref:tRNA lysidine(34) synthetase TilS n=1 Tax=Kiloniella litopenaei TaxID=1549748 RepID=UPI000ADC9E5B|nr:tRNA lysidine(34) synthetase TilS [Kiloniella litopenaei]